MITRGYVKRELRQKRVLYRAMRASWIALLLLRAV